MAGAPAHRLPYLLHGSSPHARGTLAVVPLDPVVVRFIPACAGNADRKTRWMSASPVHPRIRGERRAERGRTGSLGGSSPHARGTRHEDDYVQRTLRFIPACAGNAHALHPRNAPTTVHPRMRGERSQNRQPTGSIRGSSPHARGTPIDGQLSFEKRRFIPACAGNALNIRSLAGSTSVHPRMRGERLNGDGRLADSTGSSPHARGTPASPGSGHDL